jgi:hypothetical protein
MGEDENNRQIFNMMNRQFISYVLMLFLPVFVSCEREYIYIYQVHNGGELQVFIDARRADTHEEVTFTLGKYTTVLVHTDHVIAGFNRVPDDAYSYSFDILPPRYEKFDIDLDGVLLTGSRRMRKSWSYRISTDDKRVYELSIWDRMLPEKTPDPNR